jgi:hypothetical protein
MFTTFDGHGHVSKTWDLIFYSGTKSLDPYSDLPPVTLLANLGTPGYCIDYLSPASLDADP